MKPVSAVMVITLVDFQLSLWNEYVPCA